MNYLMNRNFITRVSLSRRRFFTSDSIAKAPSIVFGKPDIFLAAFDPLPFYSDGNRSTECKLKTTKIMHAVLVRGEFLNTDIFFANCLLDWYLKSDSMLDARRLFDAMPQRNVVSWNTLISGYNRKLLFDFSWKLFCEMFLEGLEPNEFTYSSVLSACSGLQVPRLGKLVYCLALKNGFYSNGYVRTGLIDLFSKNSSFEDALRVFLDFSCANVVAWNAIISGAVRNGDHYLALKTFREMCSGFLIANCYTFSSVLTACATLEDEGSGKAVQGWAIKCCAKDVFVDTAIVDLYVKCGNMDEALKMFLRIPDRNVVAWTSMITGYVKKDDSVSAFRIFRAMRSQEVETNNFTITSILTACAKPSMIREAIQIHAWVLKSGFSLDPVVAAALINVYSRIGLVDQSFFVFEDVGSLQIPSTWNVMISSFAQNQRSSEAIRLFRRILQNGLKPDAFSVSSLLSVIGCPKLGKQIHGFNLKTGLLLDLSVGSSLFTMYSKCGSLQDSYKVFEKISVRDNVSWASMISGFYEHGFPDKAVELFRQMLSEVGIRPDETTVSAVLTACSSFASLENGKEIHGHAIRSLIDKMRLVGSALVNMYTKCDRLDLARKVFDMLPEKDQFSCSSLVSGYAQKGLIDEALFLFVEMMTSDLAIDSFTVSSVLGAMTLSDKSVTGAQIHSYVTKIGLETDTSVASSLVMMYSKFGSVEDCCKVFNHIKNPDLVAWTAMISSYTQHGKGLEALKAYEQMKENGIKPDKVTFIGILSACSHSGLVEEGYFHLNSMSRDYGIEPGYRHYACMVDALGRAGRLKEAETFINSMPLKPDAFVWGTLLAACRVHGDVELGKKAAEKVIELEPSDAGAYVSLSNILADLAEWEKVEETRNLMKGTGLRKEPGCSSL